jgi:hypothetical protein
MEWATPAIEELFQDATGAWLPIVGHVVAHMGAPAEIAAGMSAAPTSSAEVGAAIKVPTGAPAEHAAAVAVDSSASGESDATRPRPGYTYAETQTVLLMEREHKKPMAEAMTKEQMRTYAMKSWGLTWRGFEGVYQDHPDLHAEVGKRKEKTARKR